MGKIPVQDLAKMMGISNQDLVFKLRSIGVRVEGESAHIDTDILAAILQGKKLPHPKEVILRDEPAPAARSTERRPASPPPRRVAANPLRPSKPRTVIQTVEGRIQEIPTQERPSVPVEDEVAAPRLAAEAEVEISAPGPAAEEAPAAPATPQAVAGGDEAKPAKPAEKAPVRSGARLIERGSGVSGARLIERGSGQLPERSGARLIERGTGVRPYDRSSGPPRPGSRPGGGPGGPPRPGGGRPGDRGPMRPGERGPLRPGDRGPARPGDRSAAPRIGSPPLPPRPGERPAERPVRPERSRSDADAGRTTRDDKSPKRGKKGPSLRQPLDADLSAFRGSLRSIEDVEDAADVRPATGGSLRRRRRVERKQEEFKAAESGKVLSFRDTEPSGPVMISEGMTVRDFAEKLSVKSKDLIKALFSRGILANINHVIDPELGQEIAAEMGVEAMVVSFEEEVQLRQEQTSKTGTETGARVARAPVVTIMGHVDHGKTSLLDAIRSSRIAEGEAGGITQHIGAYQVKVGERPIVFLDTPGHEAFTMMRARGARATDIVVLVVAADDGVMPQTLEAINHARAAKVPLVVAINKIDKDNANLERVKKQLADHGLLIEEWGGETVAVGISATKRQGIPELLEMILLTADLRDLKASPEMPAQGTVLEARKDIGRGIVATVLVQDGTVAVGDLFVSGATWGRVRAMVDDTGKRIDKAGPATPVEVTGFSELPEAGDLFQVVEDEVKARSIAEFRRAEQRRRDLLPVAGKRISLEQLFDRIQEGEVKELPVIIKADVQGSVEVLRDTIEKASSEKVKVRVIAAAAGAISTNDVLLASASGAIIIGFNVRPERNAAELADKEGVDIRLHTVIYELSDELKKAMTGLLEPQFEEVTRGRAEVREIFKVPKAGVVAGCHVLDGTVPRNAQIRLLRDNVVVFEGRMASLRRFKEDASEVRAGFDCGIALERFQDLKPGDIIEAYVRKEVAPTL